MDRTEITRKEFLDSKMFRVAQRSKLFEPGWYVSLNSKVSGPHSTTAAASAAFVEMQKEERAA